MQIHIIRCIYCILYASIYKHESITSVCRKRRKKLNITQVELAKKAEVGLTLVRKIDQGKEDLSMAKVNQVLIQFGHVLQPVNIKNNEEGIS